MAHGRAPSWKKGGREYPQVSRSPHTLHIEFRYSTRLAVAMAAAMALVAVAVELAVDLVGATTAQVRAEFVTCGVQALVSITILKTAYKYSHRY